ncbi:hypothetical protein [Aquabacterium sp. NJ1]|uniref:hypothetical protein n=1 Tax=Aquabacterium sp. NJ1 TaxID=1538295 RepID=UPI00126A48CE|nr:hypothetical protein [Aquabacterium sp. NJ1]
MITYQRSKSWQMAAAGLAIAVAGGATYWWFGQKDGDNHDGVVLADHKGAPSGWLQPGVGNDDPVAALKPAVASDGRPSDIQPDDWTILNQVLDKMGAQKSEATRIVGYLRYQHTFETWQTLDETKDAKKRQRMAQALLSELPDRLAGGEFTPIEANLMSAVLLADVETDEARRNQRLEEQQAKLNAIMPMSEDEQQMQAKNRQIELKRRQATAFAEWQAKTNPAERTQAKLEQAMEEVRRAYNSGEF